MHHFQYSLWPVQGKEQRASDEGLEPTIIVIMMRRRARGGGRGGGRGRGGG